MKVIKITDKEYPKRLLNIKKPPEQLYVEGNEKLLNNNSLAIVGSRDCTEYGIKYTKKFTKEIADYNITIISGLAVGIDTIAHEIAKECKGNTIAVIASGFDYIYPEENKALFQEILNEGGCIVSEYEPKTQTNMKNFPKRNRIISGIAMGVLVIEAGYRSGSIITGRYGLEQNKKVFCLPRDIGISNGIGTNKLIQKGAKLVVEPGDILEEFGIENLKKDKKHENNEESKLEVEEYKIIYNLLSQIPQDKQYLSIKSGLNISQINQQLTMLELKGYIKSLAGNKYIKIK